MKTIHDQKGFSAVEAIIVLVAVGLLGFGGWFVWQSNRDDATKTPAASDDSKTSRDTDSAKLTTKLTSHNKVFSLLLPDGWKFTNDTELDYAHAIGLDNMTYAAGTPAVVANEVGHRGGGVASASFVIQSGNTTDLENYFSASETKGTIKTTSGMEGKKYLFTAKEGDDTFVAGTKTHGYKFTNGDKTVVMTYTQLPGEPDQLKTVEDSIKTFAFL